MSIQESFRPNFSDSEIIKLVKQFYSMNVIPKELPSYRDQNFYLKADTGKEYVLKIATKDDKYDFLEAQNQCMEYINSTVQCPKVIQNIDNKLISRVKKSNGDGQEFLIRMLTYLPGKPLSDINPRTPELLSDFGGFLGHLSQALNNFSHPNLIFPSLKGEFNWDLLHAENTINKNIPHIVDSEQRAILNYFLLQYKKQIQPVLPKLRTSVLHNDGNDYNILVNKKHLPHQYKMGIIDFGDIVYSCTVFEIAIATSYAIFPFKSDPISAAATIIGSYCKIFPLTDIELQTIFILMCTRMCISVTMSVFHQKREPDNEYLKITEKPAWALLKILKKIEPRKAYNVFRQACDK